MLLDQLLLSIQEKDLQLLLLKTLAWRVGDLPDFVSSIQESFSIGVVDSIQVVEFFSKILDSSLNYEHQDPSTIEVDSSLSDDGKKRIQMIAFNVKGKCTEFTISHAPSISRVLYHDWVLGTQIATNTLGRITQPVATIILRIQPLAEGKLLLPPLRSVRMELAKDMIDALSSGFDRLQNRLVKIIK